jgi:peptidoglycan hydrolase-like protein with peptidoglycan-binding domain
MPTWDYRYSPAKGQVASPAADRLSDVDWVVIHLAEIEPEFTIPDTAGRRLSATMADHAGTGRTWHATIDADSVIHELAATEMANHLPGWNSRSVGLTVAAGLDRRRRRSNAHMCRLVENTARVTAWYCKRYDLPAELIDSDQPSRAGRRGITSPAVLDRAGGHEPSIPFPWRKFMERVAALVQADTIIAVGDRGTAVSDAQSRLTELGYGDLAGPVDGEAGSRFDRAVRAYETDRGMAATGIWVPPAALVRRPVVQPAVDATDGPTPAARPKPVDIGASVGSGGDNHPDDVRKVAERLDELGFIRPSRDLASCIRLFQSAVGGFRSLGSADGRVDPGRGALAWLNATNAPRWVVLPTGDEADGFRRRDRLERDDDRGWGTDWLARKLRAAAATYRDGYYRATPDAPLMLVGDASPPNGGTGDDTTPEPGHQAGLHLDVMLPPQDAGSWGLTTSDKAYDRDATRAMIKAFRQADGGGVAAVYLNDPSLIAEGLCQRADGHDDRIQIHLRPPERVDRPDR